MVYFCKFGSREDTKLLFVWEGLHSPREFTETVVLVDLKCVALMTLETDF